MFLFGFGKKRRRSTKSKKAGKKARKPAAKLLRLCKKLKVKTTVKRGSKRVYKSTRILKKMCSKKMRMNKKKKMSFGRRKSRKVRRSKRSKRSMMEDLDDMEFGRRSRFGSQCNGSASMMKYEAPTGMGFGKKRKGSRKISKPAAMRAFKQFYRRHCRSSAMGRRFRFGSGGNPMLSQSMGYEFCPSGMGGVLATTGLFPSPCTPFNQAQATAEANATLPEYTTTPAGAFGRRRYRRRRY